MSSDDDRALKQREAGEREAARLWRVFRTVKEMVKDRGYELTEEEVGITFDEFKRKYVTDNGEILYVPALPPTSYPS
jgi:DNA-directed RNA polymerase I, II, and III subunit RPABC1